MTNWPDIINSGFIFGASVAIFIDCRRLWIDEIVLGVSKIAAAFYGVWSWWHIWYMSHLEQEFSFIVGFLPATGDTIWIGLMIYFTRKHKGKGRER